MLEYRTVAQIESILSPNYFGTPLFFGQIEWGRESTSAASNLDLWRTPLWEGAVGIIAVVF